MKKYHCSYPFNLPSSRKKTNPSALVSNTMFYVGTVVPLTLAEG